MGETKIRFRLRYVSLRQIADKVVTGVLTGKAVKLALVKKGEAREKKTIQKKFKG